LGQGGRPNLACPIYVESLSSLARPGILFVSAGPDRQGSKGLALTMLNKVEEEVAECHRHAAECREKAEQASDPDLKRDLLALERSWHFLASSYELSDRLSDFSDEADRRKKG
jgi:hypothetical protein